MDQLWIVVAIAIVLAIVPLIFARRRTVHAERRDRDARERFATPEPEAQERSAEGVCERLAATLEANAIVVERLRDEILVVAGAPWKAEVDPLDKVALDWSFTTGLPPKSGMGNPFSSDWLFLPVQANGRVVAVLGVTARHGRRRFILDEQPAIRRAVAALAHIYGSKISRESDRSLNGFELSKAS